ncbi:NAD(P)-dependent oxidoreductase [Brevundimonas sp. FT23042]|uniref:NAD(P)-dependent oxidoreductase n=1 Tax=Brevundimonas sp. FT23042 TaxID=3393749 RepID=UPI003B58770D
MKIAVIGGTRGIGLALVHAALVEGDEVTVLVRDPLSAPALLEEARIVVGDARDPAAVAEAVSGQDVVIDCLGTTNVLNTTSLFSTSATNLSAALKPEQLLIAVTGLGAGDSRGHCTWLYDRIFLPLVLKRIYADKDRQEAIIRESVSRWIIVRPGFLTNGPRTGRYRALTKLSGFEGGPISRADVADFLLIQAHSQRFVGETPMLVY